MHEDQNYGRLSDDTAGGSYPSGGSMRPQDERTWCVLAHLSVLAGLVGLMPFGALIIWLLFKDRSQRVGFHALQALWYQVAWLIILVAGWFVTFVLSFVLVGLLFIPAYRVSQGEDYRYPFIADRIEGAGRTL